MPTVFLAALFEHPGSDIVPRQTKHILRTRLDKLCRPVVYLSQRIKKVKPVLAPDEGECSISKPESLFLCTADGFLSFFFGLRHQGPVEQLNSDNHYCRPEQPHQIPSLDSGLAIVSPWSWAFQQNLLSFKRRAERTGLALFQSRQLGKVQTYLQAPYMSYISRCRELQFANATLSLLP